MIDLGSEAAHRFMPVAPGVFISAVWVPAGRCLANRSPSTASSTWKASRAWGGDKRVEPNHSAAVRTSMYFRVVA